jgi:hypothetical protein
MPPHAVEVSNRSVDLQPDTPRPDERGLLRVTRSAAYAAECPIAVFYVHSARGFELGASVGVDTHAVTDALSRVFEQAAHLDPDDLLMVNDLSCQPGSAPGDVHLFGDDMPAMRFVAAARVVDGHGESLGVLVVADEVPHAGLSAAKDLRPAAPRRADCEPART